MLKAMTTYSKVGSIVLLSALSFGSFAADSFAMDRPVSGDAISSNKTDIKSEIATRAKTTSVVNDKTLNGELITEPLKGEQPSLTRDNDYSSKKSDANLKQELKEFKALDLKNNDYLSRLQLKQQRAGDSKLPKSSNKAQKNGLDHLYIHDAAVFLYEDDDGDGDYSKIRVDFDVDSPYDDYFDVYAQLFIRQQGDVDWTHYHTTDVFEIYYDYGSDEYSVTTRLNTGFPPGDYEILIDLFEYGYSDIVDTLDPYDDYDLANLPLEDKTYESSGVSSETYVDNVKTEIFTDADDDGFYREFTITFDVDTQSNSQQDVYVNLYQRVNGNQWQFETETEVFTVLGYSSEDAFEISGNWQSGYPAGYYDFRLEVIDAGTGEVLDDVSPEFSPLLQVPLEDANRDTRESTANPPSSTTSSESGGGSAGMVTVILLGLLGAWRRKIKQ